MTFVVVALAIPVLVYVFAKAAERADACDRVDGAPRMRREAKR